MRSNSLPKLEQSPLSNTSRTGQRDARRGKCYETDLGNLFVDIANWTSNIKPIIRELLPFISKPTGTFTSTDIKSVTVNTNIEPLSSGGPPKTDLVLSLHLCKGEVLKYRFSCKQSTKLQVSFHEYPAEDFCCVLSITDPHIRQLIHQHQDDGSAKNFSVDQRRQLNSALADKLDILAEWVILGKHHLGIAEKDQIVDLVICNDHIRTVDQYKVRLKKSRAGFGTGFNWTRQSRGMGRTIQLKGPVI